MPLEVKLKKFKNHQNSRILATGSIDDKTFKDFCKEVFEYSKKENLQPVILNFSELKYINSTGMSELIHLLDLLKEDKKDLILEEIPNKMFELFSLLGLDGIFKTFRKKYIEDIGEKVASKPVTDAKIKAFEIGTLKNKIITEVFINDIELVDYEDIKDILEKIARSSKYILIRDSGKITKKLLKLLIMTYSNYLNEKKGKIIFLRNSNQEKQNFYKFAGEKYLSCFYAVSGRSKVLELLLLKEASKEETDFEKRISSIEKEVHRIGKHFA